MTFGTKMFLAMTLAVSVAGAPAPRQPSKRLLYLTHTAGFRHDVLPLSQQVVRGLAAASGAFAVTVTDDVGAISSEGLRSFDAVFFYTTGELAMDDQQKRALIEFVKGGRGFAGAHSATDTFYTWPEYGEMIGGYFDGHPWHEDVTVRVEDSDHPATRHLPARFDITDEIYQFRNWSRDRVHVLLSLDPASVDLSAKGVNRTDRDFALAWTRQYGGGRVFYTALGHRAEVWNDERFRQHLLGGLLWVMNASPLDSRRASSERVDGNYQGHEETKNTKKNTRELFVCFVPSCSSWWRRRVWRDKSSEPWGQMFPLRTSSTR